MSVCRATSPSIIPPAPIICLSTTKSVALSVRTMASPSIVPVRLSYQQSIHPPISPGHCPSERQSPSNHLYTILPCPPGSPTLSDHTSTSLSDRPSLPGHLYDLQPSPSEHPPLSHHLYDRKISLFACPSAADCLTTTTTRRPIRLPSHTINRTQDSIQSLTIVNAEQSHTIHCTQE